MRQRRLGTGLAMAIAMALAAPATAAADMTIDPVTNFDTPGVCSLRQAIISANTNSANAVCPAGTYGNDTIRLAANTRYPLTIGGAAGESAGLTGDLDVGTVANGTLTITSPGGTVIDASFLPMAMQDRVLEIQANGDLTLTGVSIRGGTTQPGDDGGGLRNAGKLTMSNGDVSGNHAAGGGGGIATDPPAGGTLTLNNVTVSGNSASGSGGGIFKGSGGHLTTLNNSTVTANSAFDGGGEKANSGSVDFKNSLLSGNSDTGNDSPDCVAGGSSLGNTLIGSTVGCTWVPGPGDPPIGANPLLGPLADNGGLTLTHALLAGSPLIDKGAGCLPTDQRGIARPQGAGCDIGAYELTVPLPCSRSAIAAACTPPPKKCKKNRKKKHHSAAAAKKKKKCKKKKKRKK